MNQRLVRFDVRLHKDDYVKTFWDKEDRDRFLLRPEIEWPLSVDPLVWPSIFFSKIFREATKFPYGNIEVDPATDGGKYWLNLEQMRAYYQTHKSLGPPGIFVAIQLFSEESLAQDTVPYLLPGGIQAALVLGQADPIECPAGSETLGYDVADASGISGLTNCAYDAAEKAQLGQKWASRLNSYGLVRTLEDAVEFKRLSDKRAPEHAPFWVYRISRLPAS